MGASESKSSISQQNNTTIANNFNAKSVSEQINQQISNTTINSAKRCSSDINLQQAVNIKGLNVRGDFDFRTNQKQRAALTFSCVQSSEVRQSAGAEIITAFAQGISTSASSEALSAMQSAAQSQAKQGFGGIGYSSSDTNVNTISNVKVDNNTNIDIHNLVKNIVENNFTSEDVQACTSQANNSQSVSIAEVNIGGNAVIAVDQDQASEIISNCLQESSIGNNIVNNVLTKLGIQVESSNITKTASKSEAKSESKADTQGIGDGIGDIFRGFGDMFKSPYMLMCCCCCFLVIGIIVLVGGYIVATNPDLLKQ